MKKEREERRKNFVRKKVAVKSRLEHEKSLERRARNREESRKYFIKKRNEYNRIKETARKIPADKEVGL